MIPFSFHKTESLATLKRQAITKTSFAISFSLFLSSSDKSRVHIWLADCICHMSPQAESVRERSKI